MQRGCNVAEPLRIQFNPAKKSLSSTQRPMAADRLMRRQGKNPRPRAHPCRASFTKERTVTEIKAVPVGAVTPAGAVLFF
jgi:hypothetical protein